MTTTAPPDIATLEQQLIDTIRSYGSAVIAFSAGVDSTVVAAYAKRALGDRALQ